MPFFGAVPTGIAVGFRTRLRKIRVGRKFFGRRQMRPGGRPLCGRVTSGLFAKARGRERASPIPTSNSCARALGIGQRRALNVFCL
jgi:hypothetical protein